MITRKRKYTNLEGGDLLGPTPMYEFYFEHNCESTSSLFPDTANRILINNCYLSFDIRPLTSYLPWASISVTNLCRLLMTGEQVSILLSDCRLLGSLCGMGTQDSSIFAKGLLDLCDRRGYNVLGPKVGSHVATMCLTHCFGFGEAMRNYSEAEYPTAGLICWEVGAFIDSIVDIEAIRNEHRVQFSAHPCGIEKPIWTDSDFDVLDQQFANFKSFCSSARRQASIRVILDTLARSGKLCYSAFSK
jgi:hypothetical protein